MITVDVSHPVARNEAFCNWLRQHRVTPEHTFKVEIGTETMTVHQFALNEDGAKYVHRGSGEPAITEPFEVRLIRRPTLE